MFKRKFILIILIQLVGLCTFAYAQEVHATVSSNNIQLSDVFTFKVEAVKADHNPEVDLAPVLNDFSVVSGPAQQTSIQYINGKKSSSRSLQWTLVAKREGESKIPALVVKVGKKVLKTQPISMTISESAKDSESSELFLSIEVDKYQAYVGEQITVTYKMYTRVNMSIQNVDFPKHTGFWTEELFTPQQVDFKDVVLEGVSYKMAKLYQIALFPTKSGRLVLKPMTINCSVVVKQKTRSFFDDPFFGSFGNQTVPKVLHTEPTTIRVREFPGQIPVGFTGAVGNYILSSSIDLKNVKVNNAITLRIKFSGTGNIDVFKLPEIQFPQNLEVFPPTTKTVKEPFRNEISGTITQEYILIPRKTGRYQIPAIDIPYFNPKVRAWRKAVSPTLEFSAEPGDDSIVGTSSFTKTEVELLGEDIRYIRIDDINWQRSRNPYLIFGIYLLSGILVILPILIFKVRSQRINTISDRKSKKALRRAIKLLNKSGDDQFTKTANAVYGYLKDKLQLSSDKLDPLTVGSLLLINIKDKNLVGELTDILKICDAGRFAPDAESQIDTLVPNAKNILKRLNAKL